MSRNSNILDGTGSGSFLKVNEGGYIQVQNSNIPPIDDRDLQILYREFLTLNGDGSTTSMLVDGSTTSQLFYIGGISENDIYITSLSIAIQGDTINLGDDFAGSGAALANGCRLYYEDQNGEINIGTNLTTNFEFVRLCQGNPGFGDGTNSFKLLNIAAGSKGVKEADGYIPVLDFPEVFGFNYGLRLQRGTTNRLVLEVNDNLNTATGPLPSNAGFNIIAYGFQRKPD